MRVLRTGRVHDMMYILCSFVVSIILHIHPMSGSGATVRQNEEKHMKTHILHYANVSSAKLLHLLSPYTLVSYEVQDFQNYSTIKSYNENENASKFNNN